MNQLTPVSFPYDSNSQDLQFDPLVPKQEGRSSQENIEWDLSSDPCDEKALVVSSRDMGKRADQSSSFPFDLSPNTDLVEKTSASLPFDLIQFKIVYPLLIQNLEKNVKDLALFMHTWKPVSKNMYDFLLSNYIWIPIADFFNIPFDLDKEKIVHKQAEIYHRDTCRDTCKIWEKLQERKGGVFDINVNDDEACRKIAPRFLSWCEKNQEIFKDNNPICLYGREIQYLPPAISKLNQLTQLVLKNNKIKQLPSEIWCLKKLHSLDISENKLISISLGSSHLSDHLQYLNLSDNQLSYIPPEIGDCAQLKSLNLANNPLGSLPDEIGDLTDLTFLYLSNTQRTFWPSWLGRLGKLKILHLHNQRGLEENRNTIGEIPPEISSLTCLEQLFMHDNEIASIPEEINDLSRLQKLTLSNNCLDNVPGIGFPDKMRYLYLDGNQILSLDRMGDLPELRTIYFSGNPLCSLSINIEDRVRCGEVRCDVPLDLLPSASIENTLH